MKSNRLKFNSICVQEWEHQTKNEPHILPIYNTSAFVFETINDSIDIFKGNKDGYVYSRYGNPTLATVSEKLAALENIDLEEKAYALLTSSGMGAITTALLSNLEEGSKVITHGDLYGGTTELLQKVMTKYGISVFLTDFQNEDEISALIEKEQIDLMYIESPSNPLLKCIDLEMVSNMAKNNEVITVIDNTFASPYLQRPLNYGFDVVVYSTTKYLNGMGNALGGAMICKSQKMFDNMWNTLKLTGAYASPNDAWLMYNGMKTFPLRMDAHCSNALKMAQYLEQHRKVKKVNYPGLESHASHKIAKKQMSQFGGMLSFEIEGNVDTALKFMNSLNMVTMAPTLGNVDTLLLHPATSSHLKVDKEQREKVGITDGLMRLSVGIEDIDDLIKDIEQALEK